LVDNQSQTHLSEIVPALLVMPALRQFRPLIRAGDVGIEVSCVVGQSLELQLLDANDFPDQSLFDLRQFLQWHDVHLIPEVLAGEIRGGELHQFRQIRCASPIGKGSFAARGAGARDHGGHKRLAHGESGTDLDFAARGDRPVDLPGHVQLRGQTDQSGHGARGNRRDFYGNFGVLLVSVEHLIHASEMSKDANGGFAFLAEGFDDTVVPYAVRVVGLK
jgi:hypothetical protein